MTRTRLTAAERSEQLIEAAITAFAKGGYAGTATDDIARLAGVSQPYVIRLFGSKQALFITVIEHVSGRIQQAFRDAAKSATTHGGPATPGGGGATDAANAAPGSGATAAADADPPRAVTPEGGAAESAEAATGRGTTPDRGATASAEAAPGRGTTPDRGGAEAAAAALAGDATSGRDATQGAGGVPGGRAQLADLANGFDRLLEQRYLLPVLLHGFAAANADDEIGRVARACYGNIFDLVRGLTGTTAAEASDFIAKGMLLTVLASMRVIGPDPVEQSPWMTEMISTFDHHDHQHP
ncbi:TetR/AcrR family transcriptional regulator [Asanoa sp. NPDC050611]|uniref:TetR/AcrR family transcriptional regulator n=1 Tax=Asanoa sp. NPDC050611 TaxID=3157098 RepID=UPI0033E93174